MNDADEPTGNDAADPNRNDAEALTGAPVPGLDGLYADRTPSPGLEERVVEDFRSSARGRVEERAPLWPLRGGLLQAAAALVVFALGWGLGASAPWAGVGADPTLADGPAYLMLLWENEGFEIGDDPAAVARSYAAWGRSVATQGVPVTGEELGAERALLGAESRATLASARIGGFFMLGAETLDEARSLAEDHPHLASGGVIEIAPVVRR